MKTILMAMLALTAAAFAEQSQTEVTKIPIEEYSEAIGYLMGKKLASMGVKFDTE